MFPAPSGSQPHWGVLSAALGLSTRRVSRARGRTEAASERPDVDETPPVEPRLGGAHRAECWRRPRVCVRRRAALIMLPVQNRGRLMSEAFNPGDFPAVWTQKHFLRAGCSGFTNKLWVFRRADVMDTDRRPNTDRLFQPKGQRSIQCWSSVWLLRLIKYQLQFSKPASVFLQFMADCNFSKVYAGIYFLSRFLTC